MSLNLSQLTHKIWRKDKDDGELKIGTPTNFKHNIQVKHDKEKNEYTGLPVEWQMLLEKNNIKFTEATKKAALEALHIYSKAVKGKQRKTPKRVVTLINKRFAYFNISLSLLLIKLEKSQKYIKQLTDSDERIDLSGDELENERDTESSAYLSPKSHTAVTTANNHHQQQQHSAGFNTSLSYDDKETSPFPSPSLNRSVDNAASVNDRRPSYASRNEDVRLL
jgi:hypothetical protein